MFGLRGLGFVILGGFAGCFSFLWVWYNTCFGLLDFRDLWVWRSGVVYLYV